MKPHYQLKGGIWWQFKSRAECLSYCYAIAWGEYRAELAPVRARRLIVAQVSS